MIKNNIKKKYISSPDLEKANIAAYNGDLKYLMLLSTKNILPNKNGANNATANGHIDVLQFLKQFGIYPNGDGIYLAADNGHLNIIQYTINHLKRQFQCGRYGHIIYRALINDQIHIITYMVNLKDGKRYISNALEIAIRNNNEPAIVILSAFFSAFL